MTEQKKRYRVAFGCTCESARGWIGYYTGRTAEEARRNAEDDVRPCLRCGRVYVHTVEED